MNLTRFFQMRTQRRNQVFRQHRDPILVALALPYQNLPPLEFNVLHAQPQTFEQPHAGAIEQTRDQPHRPVHRIEQFTHFALRQQHRQPLRVFCVHYFVEPWQIDAKHLFIQIKKCCFGLVLRGCRDVPLHGQMGQKRLDSCGTERAWVLFVMKQDEAPRPIDIRLFGADAVVARAQMNAQLVQQLGGGGRSR